MNVYYFLHDFNKKITPVIVSPKLSILNSMVKIMKILEGSNQIYRDIIVHDFWSLDCHDI